MTDPLVAIQIGAVSFVDEGVARTLDTLVDRAAVNALFLATPTWTRGTGGRQLPGHPLPDHGVRAYDLDWRGGNYATVHPEHYGNTVLGPAGRAPEHPDLDLFDAVCGPAAERGIRSYAWMEESGYAPELRSYPNFLKVLEVDAWERPGRRPCFNHPDYRNWHLSIVEDYASHYPLDGLAWCSERPGPLNLLLQGPADPADIGCFCRHCKAMARDRGIDVSRALEGFRALLSWNSRVSSGERPRDGAFVTLWRILLRHPEILAWQTLWTDSQWQLYRDIYGTAKARRPGIEVGWHIYHNLSFSPFFRADQDYAEIGRFSDFVKVVTYDNCAGPRFHQWMRNVCRAIFADTAPDELYPVMQKLLQLDETAYESLPGKGFTADYVRRETERAVLGLAGRSKVYPGIDIDIPVGDGTEEDLTSCTRASVHDAVRAAFDGGAHGVVLSRKYSEMRLDPLAGAGDAIREFADAGAEKPTGPGTATSAGNSGNPTGTAT